MSDQIMWQVWAQSDMTEGRGPMRPTGKVFATEQEAWDSINDHGGIMGRRPGVNCYPMDKCKDLGITNWQQMVDLLGAAYSDYDVQPIKVSTLGDKFAETLPNPALAQDLRDLLDELDAPDERTVVGDRGTRGRLMPRYYEPDAPFCVSCKREATHKCTTKLGLLKRCGEALCDDCTHYDDKRWPIHDRDNTDRSGHQWIAEHQAEELEAIGSVDTELDATIDALQTASDAVGQVRESLAKPPSPRQQRKQRDDLMQLLDELKPQTVVLDGLDPTSQAGEPDA